jgi:hypothetical protein
MIFRIIFNSREATNLGFTIKHYLHLLIIIKIKYKEKPCITAIESFFILKGGRIDSKTLFKAKGMKTQNKTIQQVFSFMVYKKDASAHPTWQPKNVPAFHTPGIDNTGSHPRRTTLDFTS